MMSQTDLLISFWGYAPETAAFILNRAPTKAVEGTPYGIWYGKKPILSFLKIWGCEAYVKCLLGDQLESKSDKCIFQIYLESDHFLPLPSSSFWSQPPSFLTWIITIACLVSLLVPALHAAFSFTTTRCQEKGLTAHRRADGLCE